MSFFLTKFLIFSGFLAFFKLCNFFSTNFKKRTVEKKIFYRTILLWDDNKKSKASKPLFWQKKMVLCSEKRAKIRILKLNSALMNSQQ